MLDEESFLCFDIGGLQVRRQLNELEQRVIEIDAKQVELQRSQAEVRGPLAPPDHPTCRFSLRYLSLRVRRRQRVRKRLQQRMISCEPRWSWSARTCNFSAEVAAPRPRESCKHTTSIVSALAVRNNIRCRSDSRPI